MGNQTVKQPIYVTKSLYASRSRHIASLGLADMNAYRLWCRANGFGASGRKTWRQRRHEKRHAIKLAVRSEALDTLRRHIHDLNMRGFEYYADWCLAHRFTTALYKNAARRKQEALTARRELAEIALIAGDRARNIAQQAERDPSLWLEAAVEGSIEPTQLPAPFLQRLYNVARTETSRRVRSHFLRLLRAVCQNSGLLREPGGLPCMAQGMHNTYLRALLALSRRYDCWLRAPEDWQPKGKAARGQFSGLARHLFAYYAVPAYMDRAWFEGEGQAAQKHQGWFRHVGKGGNLRTADLPFPLTKMAAHYALKAPADFEFTAALRWGQVRGAGGDESLARAVAASLLSEVQTEEAFWASVIVWLANHPELDFAQVGPLLDFIYNIKYMPREILRENEDIEFLGAAEPDFEMKGRTPAALLRRMETWHRQLAQESKRPPREWERMNVGEFLLEQHDAANDAVLHWTIRELLCSKELEEEGQAMNNCVASYIDACVKGSSRIWSLRVASPNTPAAQRVMTIEVDPNKRAIVQARGKCNVTPDMPKCTGRLKLAPSLLRRWAAQQNLVISPHVW